MRIIQWLLLVISALFITVYAACGQSVSPLAAEAKAAKATKGEFTVRNVGVQPITVVIEPKSFTIDKDGNTAFRPLDPGVDVKLDAMSAKVGAQQFRTFGYTVSCAQYPCAIAFYSGFGAGHTDSGIAVKIWLPTTLYICSASGKGCRERVRKEVFHLSQ
jgi:hypothetical protein